MVQQSECFLLEAGRRKSYELIGELSLKFEAVTTKKLSQIFSVV